MDKNEIIHKDGKIFLNSSVDYDIYSEKSGKFYKFYK